MSALEAISVLAAETGRDVSSVMLTAADTHVRSLLITWAGGVVETPIQAPKNGITTIVGGPHARSLLLMPVADLDESHLEAMSAAWVLGAWDVAIHTWPASACQGLMMPWAAGAYDLTYAAWSIEPLDDIHDVVEVTRLAAQRGGMVQWSFKPMAYGPAIRRKQTKPDQTLASDGTRSLLDLPACGDVPKNVAQDSCQHAIRFGRA